VFWIALEVTKWVLMAIGLWYVLVILGVFALCWSEGKTPKPKPMSDDDAGEELIDQMVDGRNQDWD